MGLSSVVIRLTMACCLALASLSAEASTLRCGGGVVSHGDSVTQVLARCGEPDRVDRYRKELKTTNHIGIPVIRDVAVEHWSYERGHGKFVQTLIFEGGRLTRIKRGPRQ